MLTKLMSRSFILKLAIVLIFCASLSYVVADAFGSPENSSRRVDWLNGVGFNCEPPGYLCRVMN